MKKNFSLVSLGQMKRLVNASNYFALMIIKPKEEYVSGYDLGHKHGLF